MLNKITGRYGVGAQVASFVEEAERMVGEYGDYQKDSERDYGGNKRTDRRGRSGRLSKGWGLKMIKGSFIVRQVAGFVNIKNIKKSIDNRADIWYDECIKSERSRV